MSRSAPTPIRLVAALSLAFAASAQAIVVEAPAGSITFNWGLDAENSETQTFQYVYPGEGDAALSTGGVRTAQVGNVSASVNAWVDPVSGVFKSINTATTGSASRPASIAQSYSRLDLTDTVRISGPGATTTVTFRMSYDTQFSGLGLTPFEAGDLAQHLMQVDSTRNASLSYQLPNPLYDPAAECTGSGELLECGPETNPFLDFSESGGKQLFREWAQSERGFIYGNGDVNNGRYTGEVLLTLVVPTGVDLRLDYSVHNNARCFHLSNCSVSVDASHSDYIGLELADGYAFTSSLGLRYEGLAAAVPEPTSLGLMLAGLVGLGAVRAQSIRQSRRQARA